MSTQRPEKLEYKGRVSALYSYPPVPTEHPRVISQPVSPHPISALLRGYVGTWRIENDRLFLTALEGRYTLEGEAVAIPDYSGALILPDGVQLGTQPEPGIYRPFFESEIHIHMEKGRVIHEQRVQHRRP